MNVLSFAVIPPTWRRTHYPQPVPSALFNLVNFPASKRRASQRVLPLSCSASGSSPQSVEELKYITKLVRGGELRKATEVLRTSSLAAQARSSKEFGLRVAQQLLNAAPAFFPGCKKEDQQRLSEKSEIELEKEAQLLYNQLRDLEMLQAFGSLANPSALPLQEKIVSTEKLVEQAGVPISALSPRRRTLIAWQFGGVAALLTVALTLRAFGRESLIGPVGLVLGFVFFADQIVLRGATFEAIYRYLFPHYGEKVLRHEAAHFLLAYLQGCPVRGYILNALDAVRVGIPGQAGTIFSDGDLRNELNTGRLRIVTIDRYSIVLLAGIAAEALLFGQAEGGRSDESALVALLTSLKPPWSSQAIFNQARWAVLEALLLLKRNREAFEKLSERMKEGAPVGDCVACIEQFAKVQESKQSWALAQNAQVRGVKEVSETGARVGVTGEVEKVEKASTGSADTRSDIDEKEELLNKKIEAVDAQLKQLEDSAK